MKIAVCISNNKIKIKHAILDKFTNKIFKDNYNWGRKFADYLDKYNIDYDFINIDKNDWLEEIEKYDIVLWKPAFMGPQSSQHFRSKVYFIQHIMKKRIYPNYESVWHFDNKISQSYFFKYKKINAPKTFATFDYNEAMAKLEDFNYPLIFKESNGAGSSGVKLVKSYKQLVKIVNNKFIYHNIISRILKSNLFDRFGEIYLQEFLENNKADLRINIIGNKYATGFWRKNRSNDFRASGSGNIDYETEIPENIIRYCWQISRDNNFDSMAYDVLFRDNQFFIIEMSYGYADSAVYNSAGYYELDGEGNIIEFNKGRYWPQELWVKWLIQNETII
ncbi:hypothetical protein BKP37_16645 [Anaerobacillus alkalilacustris]|uniref:ATP-grasp domain-containing protein n=1 Tax=Anaerobacillus alkalilacustris TaxID=393763 RepID=A0A1S2LG97_9BACI|nr:hypothetical protein [Anaerobacillus alkalilacustris]OIJ11270.1 hypothetical protein BKP37_16645 [Anaerobacillus alkalilacustris]